MMHLSSNRLSLEQHLLSSELIIQLLCFPSRCLVEFSRILIKTHFQTPWMLISSEEIKTISTINIKLQLSHQAVAGFQPRQGLGISHWCPSMFNRKTALCTDHWPAYVWVWLWGYSSWVITALHRHQGCCMGSLSCSLEHGAPPAWVQTCPNAHSYLPLCALEDTAVGSSSQLTSRQMLFISKLLVSLLSSVTLGEG